MTELIEEPCERSPFDFVTDDEHRFVFDEGDALMIECAIELTPFDGLLLAGFVEAGSDSCDDDDATDLTGARIWPGAGILAHFVAANPNITRNRAIVELGAGAGVCGLASARRAGGHAGVCAHGRQHCMCGAVSATLGVISTYGPILYPPLM